MNQDLRISWKACIASTGDPDRGLYQNFLKKDLTVVEKKALYYGLQALLTTKVLTSDRKRI